MNKNANNNRKEANIKSSDRTVWNFLPFSFSKFGQGTKKMFLLTSLVCLVGCAYSPVIDSRGNKGKQVAYRLTDDMQTCKAIAKQNTNNFIEAYKAVYNYYFRPAVLWLPDKMEFKYKHLVKNCLTNRGHSVLD